MRSSYNVKQSKELLSLFIFCGITLTFLATTIWAKDYEVVSIAYQKDQVVTLDHLYVIEKGTRHDAIEYFQKSPPTGPSQDNFLSHQGKLYRIQSISLLPNDEGYVGIYSQGTLDSVPSSKTLTWPYIASTKEELLYRNKIQTFTSEEDLKRLKPALIPAEDISKIALTDLDNNGQLDKITLFKVRNELNVDLPSIAINLNSEEEFKLISPGSNKELLQEIGFVGAIDWNHDGTFELVFSCEYYESAYYILVNPFNQHFTKSHVRYVE